MINLLCNKLYTIDIIIFIILVIVGLCFALKFVDDYNCDNGLFVNAQSMILANQNVSPGKKCDKDKSNGLFNPKNTTCLSENGIGKCFVGNTYKIIIIVAIVISSLILLTKIFCLFAQRVKK